MERRLRLRALEQLRGATGALLLIALAAVVILPLVMRLRRELGGFYSTLGDPSPTLWLIAAAVVLGAMVVAIGVRANFRARLVLDAEGIRYESGWPGAIAARFDWRLRWSEIRAARAMPASRLAPLLRAVVLETSGGERRLLPWQWIDPADPADAALTREVERLGVDRTTLARVWEETALARTLTDRGLLQLDERTADAADDVQSSATARVLAVAMVVAIFYSIVDIYFGLDEFYAGAAPYPAFVAVGAAAAALGWGAFAPRLRRRGEALAIAVMFGFGIGLATYPLALRVNAWTDEIGLVEREYLLVEDGRWICLDGGAPTLTFDIGTGYWRQFQQGHRKTFHVRRGGLGFHQVDMTPVYAEQREFYRRKG